MLIIDVLLTFKSFLNGPSSNSMGRTSQFRRPSSLSQIGPYVQAQVRVAMTLPTFACSFGYSILIRLTVRADAKTR